MTAERIRVLDAVGFDWDPHNDCWNVRFEQLCEFKVHFGHCLVPIKYSAIPKLGPWVSKQHYNYKLQKEGKPSLMTAERIRELESIGFDWGTSQTDWSVRLQQLCEFKAHFGHCLVPIKYSANSNFGW